jgi:hypothetical protein
MSEISGRNGKIFRLPSGHYLTHRRQKEKKTPKFFEDGRAEMKKIRLKTVLAIGRRIRDLRFG